jgi:hypothetical protein
MALGMGSAHAALRILIANANAPGVGFNDPTPATPIGGNTGTTVGQQRLIAFTYAANLWGATLTSNVPVVINAQFSALTCTATSATLGSAGATSVFRDFAGAPKAATWYSYALANKISGRYLGTSKAAQINANFNANLGTTGCLEGSSWYYGLDSNEGTGQIDFVAVLQHEMSHGLGFQTFTSGSTGAYLSSFPSVWDHFLFGTTAGKFWKDMTAAERVASAISVNGLVWNGPLVTAAAASTLKPFQNLAVGGNNYAIAGASFGPLLTAVPFTGTLAALPVTSTSEACAALNAAEIAAVAGKIALISRGTCAFTIKVKNAQDAGAIGVVIIDNVNATLAGLSGTDPTITIPAARVSLADGTTLRTLVGSSAALTVAGSMMAGADSLGRMLMYAPNPFASGSSVSHYDVSAIPNMLMEPAINSDLTQNVVPPFDLTLKLFQEIGW